MSQACRNALHAVNLRNGSHTGLVLDRYLKTANDGENAFRDSRDELLDAATGIPNRFGKTYTIFFRQWVDSLPGNVLRADFEVDGRLVSGLGSASPIETGLRLHHTYGVPMIPGSALKGLASHYCDQVWGAKDTEFKRCVKGSGPEGSSEARPGKWFHDLFGDAEERGHILFHDAWILPTSMNGCLQADVMTVHHPDYYQKAGGAGGPTDFDDPTPIPFLSVRGKFRLAVGCDVPGEVGTEWANLAMKILEGALSDWGIGGKTAAGYGRMARLKETAKIEEPPGLGKEARPPAMIDSVPENVLVLSVRLPNGKYKGTASDGKEYELILPLVFLNPDGMKMEVTWSVLNGVKTPSFKKRL